MINSINLAKNAYEGSTDPDGKKSGIKNEELFDYSGQSKMTVFDDKAIAAIKSMASMRMYKCNGMFNNRIMSTCPSYPPFHMAHGEPTYKESFDMEMDLKRQQSMISKSSLKLIGRIDQIELNEHLREVYVKDDLGVYIMYDCSLQDMSIQEEQLLQICSFYLNRQETLQDPHTDKPNPCKDRLQIIDDILALEAEFQFKKVKLVMSYMEAYEHITDPLEQQKTMQIVTDIMARRPRLNMQAHYFRDSYMAELRCLDAQMELIQMLISNQIKIEREQNRML